MERLHAAGKLFVRFESLVDTALQNLASDRRLSAWPAFFGRSGTE
jgi:hypothetical protein